ncbi:MAG: DUF3999 family protein, partial [Verrucomicrobium sp.]|nr:DUF3999 family protein [Verrucomicrobium sp.]
MRRLTASASLLMSVLMATLASGQSTAPPPFQNWSHVQAVTVAEAGLVRMELPPVTQAIAQPGLGDVRLIRSDGVETPYLVESPTLDAVLLKPVRSVQTQLQGQQSILSIETGREEALRALVLRTGAGTFLKAVTVEGSQDGAQWQSLSEPTVLFRQTDGSSRLRLNFPPGSWKHLRVTVDDQRTSPVVFTGAEVELQQEASATVAEQVTVQKTEETEGQTRLTLKLQTPHAWLGAVKLQTTESVFSRRAVLQQLTDGAVVAEATVYRLGVGDRQASSLVIPVNRQVTGGELLLTLENGSSPPLKVQAVEATRYPVHLVFQADNPGVWQLYGGNARVAAPRYDLAALGGQLKTLTARAATPGPLMANPDFKKDAGLAPFAESGGGIDTTPWRLRKAVTIDGSGVQSLLLDLETVSHSASGGSDLRLVQDGRQIPYVLRPKVKMETLALPAQAFPDARHPTYSRWKLELPHADIPVESLQLVFATPFLDRTFLIRVEQIDQAGQSRWQEYR